MSSSTPKKRRSQAWFEGRSKDNFIHRSWMKSEGLPDDSFDGRPVIGICNTWSDLTPCNHHFRELAERVRHGVLQAGGLPLEFPVSSLGETLMRPTAMLFRNLASMDVEEAIRAHPLDGVVLLAGCDKTTPATLMGAASVNLPTIVVSGGAMLNGRFRGQTIGSGTHVWKFAEAVAAGTMSEQEFMQAERCMSRSSGVCMTMGTASTMACLVEADAAERLHVGETIAASFALPDAGPPFDLHAVLCNKTPNAENEKMILGMQFLPSASSGTTNAARRLSEFLLRRYGSGVAPLGNGTHVADGVVS